MGIISHKDIIFEYFKIQFTYDKKIRKVVGNVINYIATSGRMINGIKVDVIDQCSGMISNPSGLQNMWLKKVRNHCVKKFISTTMRLAIQ
jgi:hypothetical protein